MVVETADTWRAYNQEWVVVFTEGQLLGGVEQAMTCEEYYEATYVTATGRARLLPQDHRVDQHPLVNQRRRLEVKKWVLRGEFKFQQDAESFKASVREEYLVHIVGRGTRAEVDLRDYGKRMLK